MSHIILQHPVAHLTEDEVLTTLRLMQLHVQLMNPSYPREVVIKKNDPRLMHLPDTDKFLAMLIDYEMRELLLCTRDLVRKFQGTGYHWRKIAHQCPVTSVASALSNTGDPGYRGRGWQVAPHICRLIRWIVNHTDNEDIKLLEGLY
jgi:hypothetical protein